MAEQSQDLPIVDFQKALFNLDGNGDILHEIVNLFMDGGRERLDSIAEAIAAGDVSTTAILSHGVKGGASNFCALRFCEAALQLELLAKSGTLDGADQLYETMVTEYCELEKEMERMDWEAIEKGEVQYV